MKYKDFKCSCACGQRVRVLFSSWKKGKLLDIGIMRGREKRPKVGVVLRDDGLKEFLKFVN